MKLTLEQHLKLYALENARYKRYTEPVLLAKQHIRKMKAVRGMA